MARGSRFEDWVPLVPTATPLANACPVRVTEKEKMNVFVPFPVTPI